MRYTISHTSRMAIGHRIQAARKAKGWSQTRLAEAIDKAQTAISSWERGRTVPSRADAVRIANVLKIPLTDIEDYLRDAPQQSPVMQIPVLSWATAGLISHVGAIETVPAMEEITVADLPVGEYFATDVPDDSMDRISPEGSRIIVNTRDRRLVAGRAYLFSVRGETMYRLYQHEPIPRLEPHSINPAHKTLFPGKRDTWIVIGRVMRSYFDLP